MPKPLTPKTFNITRTFRLSIEFTFGTHNNINLGVEWFKFSDSEGFWLGNLLSLEIQLPCTIPISEIKQQSHVN
jgi:hypothetical protein